MSENTSKPSVYYRVQQADGRVAIVDSLDALPAAERARAQRIELRVASPASPAVSVFPAELDWPSFGVGFGAALVFALLVLFLGKGRKGALVFAGAVGFIVLGASAYFGWLRRSTGQDAALFASPASVVDDARRAVDQMQKKQLERNEMLKQIEKESK
jgi:hypothetical protein